VASSNPLRELPSVDELLGRKELEALTAEHGRPLVKAAAQAALARAREDVKAGFPAGDPVERTVRELDARLRPGLRRVLNATGIVVHTNLGRAPLAEAALARVHEVGAGYSNLEYDLESGSRGSRQDHLAAVLRELSGAEAAIVVNNNAAAVLLAVAALAEGREVIVSRGELIEIGDGFRIPDVLTRSGATLVEVGTTNRTRLADFERALTERTAALLRVHQSNFRMVGFTEQPRAAELARLAERRGCQWEWFA
jgi:L-seryl-tRNA(Ser) seleniumtransferase